MGDNIGSIGGVGGINVGTQNAEKIVNYQVTITDPKDLAEIDSSLKAMREELLKTDLPAGVDKEKLIEPINELIAEKEAQKDENVLKAKLEKVNESLNLFGKTLKGIETIAPYVGKIAKIVALPFLSL